MFKAIDALRALLNARSDVELEGSVVVRTRRAATNSVVSGQNDLGSQPMSAARQNRQVMRMPRHAIS
ncbi:MAG: hypothetical protein WBV39_16125 [Rudaea sp.]